MENEAQPAAVEAADPAWVNGRRVFPLAKAIPDGGADVKSITFREPNAGDIIACGNPVELDLTTGKLNIDQAAMGRMIAQLAAIAPSSVARMSPQDYLQAGWVLAPFFVPKF